MFDAIHGSISVRRFCCNSSIYFTPAPAVPCSNTRANVSIPDLYALEHRILAIKTEMPGLAKGAAEVEGERKVSTS